MYKIKIFLNIFFKILKADKFFLPPKKKLILLYDCFVLGETTINFLKPYIDEKDIQYLDIRFKQINLYVLFLTIIKYGIKHAVFNYASEFIRVCDPKLIINFTDADLRFYKLKKRFKKKIFISIQIGYRVLKADDLFSKLLKEKNSHNKYSCDYIICYGKKIGQKYEKLIDCKVIPAGSFKNNYLINISDIKLLKPKIKISFISQFRLSKESQDGDLGKIEGLPKQDFYRSETLFLPRIQKKCNQLGVKLNIIGCTLHSNKEKIFFEKILNNNNFNHEELKISHNNFTLNNSKKIDLENYNHLINFTRDIKSCSAESYIKMLNSEIIFFVDSTLGYEALALGKKVASFNTRPTTFKNHKILGKGGFGWPKDFGSNKGLFWTNIHEIEEADRIIDNVLSINDNDWKSELQEINPDVINYENDNSSFKKILRVNYLDKNINE